MRLCKAPPDYSLLRSLGIDDVCVCVCVFGVFVLLLYIVPSFVQRVVWPHREFVASQPRKGSNGAAAFAFRIVDPFVPVRCRDLRPEIPPNPNSHNTQFVGLENYLPPPAIPPAPLPSLSFPHSHSFSAFCNSSFRRVNSMHVHFICRLCLLYAFWKMNTRLVFTLSLSLCCLENLYRRRRLSLFVRLIDWLFKWGFGEGFRTCVYKIGWRG